jgi:hypothetical protein
MPRGEAVGLLRIPETDPRDAEAVCASCGRSGSWALITYVNEPVTLERYCRRCWPGAHRASEDAVSRAMESHWAAQWAWMRQPRRDHAEPAAPPALRGRVMIWHWSLTAGTWWRSLRHEAAVPAFPSAAT